MITSATLYFCSVIFPWSVVCRVTSASTCRAVASGSLICPLATAPAQQRVAAGPIVLGQQLTDESGGVQVRLLPGLRAHCGVLPGRRRLDGYDAAHPGDARVQLQLLLGG